jgi:hypothetical protein
MKNEKWKMSISERKREKKCRNFFEKQGLSVSLYPDSI